MKANRWIRKMKKAAEITEPLDVEELKMADTRARSHDLYVCTTTTQERLLSLNIPSNSSMR